MAWPGSARIKAPKRAQRELWVGFSPNGVGQQKPNHFLDMAKTAWVNRRHLPFAWRILSKGVCDGCALGVAGFHDWTISGVHLCTTRLNLLRLNTMVALDPAVLGDVDALRALDGAALRELGRLPYPMIRRAGEPGFLVATWDEALDLIADRIRVSEPDAFALYLTARGITNEVYYAAQKATRFLGTNNVDNASRVSRAFDYRAEARHRCRCHHLFVHRCDRERAHRLVRQQRGERSTRLHEVPVPRAQARREGRGDQSGS